LDDGGVGSEGLGAVGEAENGAGEDAATVAVAVESGFTGRIQGDEMFVLVEDVDLKVFPKIAGPLNETNGCPRARAGGSQNGGTVSGRE